MSSRNSILQRIKHIEAKRKKNKKKVYVFRIHEDFAGPKAMRKEFSKSKYRGCVLILNDIR